MIPEKDGSGFLRFDPDRDIKVFEGEIERESVMKFKPVYEAMHQFLGENGFVHPLSGNDQVEDLYWERWMPSGAKEQHIWWRVKKDVLPYIRYFYAIDWQTLNVSKREVMHKNKKYNIEYVDLIIRVKAWVQFDYKDLFKDSIIWQVKKMFFNRIYREHIEQHKVQLYDLTQDMLRMLKSVLEMVKDDEWRVQTEPKMGFKEW